MITIPRKRLLDAAEISARVSSSRHPETHLFGSSAGFVVRSTDGVSGVETVIEADCELEDFRIPASQFASILKGMRSDNVTLDRSGKQCSLFGPAEKFCLRESDVDVLPWEDVQGETCTVPAEQLRHAIERCLPAVDDSGPFALQGLYVSAKNGRLSVSACDGKRLHTQTVCPCSHEWSGPLPKRTAQTFAKILSAGDAVFTFGNNILSLRCAERLTWALTMSGRFPDASAIEAKLETQTTFVIHASELVRLAKQSLLVSDRVSLSVEEGMLSVNAYGDTGSVDLSIPVPTVDAGAITLNNRMLLDAADVHSGSDELSVTICSDKLHIRNGLFVAMIAGVQCD